MISRNCSPVKAIINEIHDPKNELKIIPVKINVSIFIVRSTSRAKLITVTIVIIAPTMLKIGSVYCPKKGNEIPKKIVATAPTEAPAEPTVAPTEAPADVDTDAEGGMNPLVIVIIVVAVIAVAAGAAFVVMKKKK